MLTRHLIASSLAILVCSTSVLAQDGSVGGRVSDPQGGVVSAAAVTLTAAGSGPTQPRTATTAADGTYSVSAAPGTYVLQVEAPGFESWLQSVVVSTAPQTVDVVLSIGGITENVVVAAPRLEEELPQEIERSGVRMQTITSTQIANGGYNDVALRRA